MVRVPMDPLRRHLWRIHKPGAKPGRWVFPPMRAARTERELRRLLRRRRRALAHKGHTPTDVQR
jgi:hypothetical protein